MITIKGYTFNELAAECPELEAYRKTVVKNTYLNVFTIATEFGIKTGQEFIPTLANEKPFMVNEVFYFLFKQK